MATDRLATLKNLVEQNQDDNRVRYMLAIELANAGALDDAVAQYREILSRDADYVAAYYQCGRVLEKLGQAEAAREIYRQGIEACSRTGDTHTSREIQEALDALA